MGDPKRVSTKTVYTFLSLAELGLLFRFVFRLFDADVTNSFVQWVYAMSQSLLEPTRNIIGATTFDQRFILDFQTLLAMAFWAVLGYLVLVVVSVVPRPRLEHLANWRKWVKNKI